MTMVKKWGYLLSKDAQPLFETVYDIIIDNKCSSILDVACGYSKISELLDFSIDGIDLDPDAIQYCENNYNGNYKVMDVMDLSYDTFKKDYDCLVISGLLYYFKNGFYGGITMTEFMKKMIDTFDPKLVVVTEPQDLPEYNSPDYSEFLEIYKPNPTYLDLNIRMGKRVVYEIKL